MLVAGATGRMMDTCGDPLFLQLGLHTIMLPNPQHKKVPHVFRVRIHYRLNHTM